MDVRDTRRGFSGPEACVLAGITYRQIDYWARIRLVEPSLRKSTGSGDRRRYSTEDVRLLMLLGQVEPSQRRIVADAVRENGGTCRRLIVNRAENSVVCCNTDADVLEAVKAARGVLTMFDLDELLPDLVDA
jgi:hypothetical protein